jgi:hypothetical protein
MVGMGSLPGRNSNSQVNVKPMTNDQIPMTNHSRSTLWHWSLVLGH